MQFVFPSFLWALLLLAIPVIIHLFYFKRFKKVYFTNVKFLKEVKEETSNRNRIRNLLVLLSRLAALACLIFAFAQPYLSNKKVDHNRDNYISMFIDNSFSMKSRSESVSLLDNAKSMARQIVNSYSEADQFQLVTHELNGQQQRWISKEDILVAIEEIEATPEVHTLSEVVSRQEQMFEDLNANNNIYLLSDFQKNITDLDVNIDSTLDIKMMPLQSIKENNISIDSAWFLSPVPLKNQANRLVVNLTNYGDDAKDDVRLFVNQNGQSKPVGSIDIAANSKIQDTIDLVFLEGGWQNIEIKVEDFPIQFDDSYLVSFQLNDDVKILSLNQSGQNRYVNSLVQGLANFNLVNQTLSNIRYNEFPEFDLIILNDLIDISSGLSSELENYILNGGKVLLFPSKVATLEKINQFLSKMAVNSFEQYEEKEREVFKLNTNDFIFSDVYEKVDQNLKLPNTSGNYISSNFSSRGGEAILSYRDGSPFISKYIKEKGILYVCNASLDIQQSDLARIAEVFVPMIYKMALAKNSAKPLAYVIGGDNIAETNSTLSGAESVFKVTGQQEFIPGQTRIGRRTIVDFNDMITESGFYNLAINDTIVDKYAFNHNRLESELDFVPISDLRSKYGDSYQIFDDVLRADLSQLVQQEDKGKILWRLFLVLALIFLAIETLLLRFWKT